ncbi:MAG: FMN-binding negative transcriptional regulator [Chloroflexi bacterium]|nr:FMN-binding negative transcriptional regulator [Chloroflexota bacterium]
MYLPEHFAETDREVLQRLIAEHPLGTLVTLGADGLGANHLPFSLVAGVGEQGALLTHVARGNHVWHDVSPEHEALVIFQGPSAYISPNWYPTKAETHRQVPTYNYVVVHAYGRLVIHDDEKWLRGFLGRLTQRMEATQPTPWKMGDAPHDFVRQLLEGIVGIEIPISRLIGKWKVSQNRLPVDRDGAVAGLRATGGAEAAAMADLIAAAATRTSPAR